MKAEAAITAMVVTAHRITKCRINPDYRLALRLPITVRNYLRGAALPVMRYKSPNPVSKKSKKKHKDDSEEIPKRKVSKPRAAKPRKKAAPAPQPTDEEISIRAYFISERRHRLALPGDASSDWIEARRQLLSEASPA
jgi:hypothetical protein